MSSFGVPGLFDGWDVLRLIMIIWVIGLPITFWRKLGDAEFVASLKPHMQKVYGVKLEKGANGKMYAEPPPPLKRLQISLAIGLLTAAFLCGIISFAVHLFD